MQNYVFELMAQIMPTVGLVKALLGTADLKELRAKLDFTTNKLEFSLLADIPFKVFNPCVVEPGTSRLVELVAKLPSNAQDGEIVLNCTADIHHITSSSVWTNVTEGRCFIPIFQ